MKLDDGYADLVADNVNLGRVQFKLMGLRGYVYGRYDGEAAMDAREVYLVPEEPLSNKIAITIELIDAEGRAQIARRVVG